MPCDYNYTSCQYKHITIVVAVVVVLVASIKNKQLHKHDVLSGEVVIGLDLESHLQVLIKNRVYRVMTSHNKNST